MTGMQVVLDTLEYGSAIKKTPVVVGNCTGFAVNRVFFPYTQARCWAPTCPMQGLCELLNTCICTAAGTALREGVKYGVVTRNGVCTSG